MTDLLLRYVRKAHEIVSGGSHHPSPFSLRMAKWMRRQWRHWTAFGRGSRSVPRLPEVVFLSLNDVCNLHCTMCDVGVENREGQLFQFLRTEGPVMEMGVLRRMIDELSIEKPLVSVVGTEPLLSKNLVPFLEYAARRRVPVSLITNGLLLPKLAESIARSGVVQVVVSLDGPPELHNRIRGNRVSFEMAVRGIEALDRERRRLRRRYPVLSANYTIFNQNHHALTDFLDSIRPYPFDDVLFTHMNYVTPAMAQAHNVRHGSYVKATPTCYTEGASDPACVDTDVLWAQIERVRRYAVPHRVGFAPELDRQGVENHYRHPEVPVFRTRCRSAWTALQICANGDLRVAGRCFPLTLGNIRNGSLTAFWGGEGFQRFRAFIDREGMTPACTRCCSVMS